MLPERLTDGRVVVRRYRPDDVDRLAEAVTASLPELRRWMPWAQAEPIPRGERVDLVDRFIATWGEDHTVVICAHDDDRELLGGAGLHARIGPGGWEIGYWVRTDRAGAGIASAAARLLTDAAFEHLDAGHVEIHHDAGNVRSARVPRRLGLDLVAIEPDPPVAPDDTGIEWRWRTTPERWPGERPSWPPPPVVTPRLRLRAAHEADRLRLIEQLTSSDVRRHLGGPLTHDDAVAAMPAELGRRPGALVLADRDTDRVVGAVRISHERGEPEVSYELRPEVWGRGLATEGVAAALHRAWAADGVEEVIAVTQTANAASVRLLERLGFAPEDTFVEFDAEQRRFRARLPLATAGP